MLCFSPNRGLTTVFRSKAGHCFEAAPTEDNSDSDYWNNAHWLESNKNWAPAPSNFVHYYDAASLYPSSGKC